MIGAGGAARAVILALAEAGAADVAVVNRTAARAETAAALAGTAGRVGSGADVAGAELVVQATPVGMAGARGSRRPTRSPSTPRRCTPGRSSSTSSTTRSRPRSCCAAGGGGATVRRRAGDAGAPGRAGARAVDRARRARRGHVGRGGGRAPGLTSGRPEPPCPAARTGLRCRGRSGGAGRRRRRFFLGAVPAARRWWPGTGWSSGESPSHSRTRAGPPGSREQLFALHHQEPVRARSTSNHRRSCSA